MAVLGALSYFDIKEFRLPDILTKPLIAAGLVYNFIEAQDFYPFLLGAFVGYAVFWIFEVGYKWLRGQDGLGRGDAKLLAAGGAWCAWTGLPFIILIASASALMWIILTGRVKTTPDSAPLILPFGPFLSFAIALIWLSQSLNLS